MAKKKSKRIYGQAKVQVIQNIEYIQNMMSQGYSVSHIYSALTKAKKVTVTYQGFIQQIHKLINDTSTETVKKQKTKTAEEKKDSHSNTADISKYV